MDKPKIGISIGDFNGIGLEVALKTLMHEKILDICIPVVYGSSKVVSYHKNIVSNDFQFASITGIDQLKEDQVNIINCWPENVNITLGKPSDVSGQYAIRSLEAAVNDLRDGHIQALVTAPINKHAMKLAGFPFPGHTEYLTQSLGNNESLMLMVSDNLRVGLATNHLPLEEVAPAMGKHLVIRKLQIMEEALKMDFGIERPTIAVLGLNPHAGDEGTLGEEEEKFIRPAVVEMKKKGMLVMGPYAADGFFGSGQYTKFDGILAMYHDQGLVPFKLLSFGKGVNYTAGLSAVRTSPDHGTGYDLAGKNEANFSSFQQALFLALVIYRQRNRYLEMNANPLAKKEKAADTEGSEEVIGAGEK